MKKLIESSNNWPFHEKSQVCQTVWRLYYPCVRAKSLQLRWTLCDPLDCGLQTPLSMGFSRQEYWRGLPCPPPWDLPSPRTEPMSPECLALAGRFFTTSTTWEAPLLSNQVKENNTHTQNPNWWWAVGRMAEHALNERGEAMVFP